MPRHNPQLNHQRDMQHAQAVAKAIREAQDTDRKPILPGTLPGDPWALRGIPIASQHGVGGAIPGTRPDRITS